MSFKDDYPEYASVEEHIRRAHLERSVAIGTMIAGGIAGAVNLVKSFAQAHPSSARDEERLAIAADPFLKRSVPKY
jgi:hypothetical protein